MHHNFTADKCKLVGDEDGWVLEIETDEGDDLRVNIHSCAWEFAGTLDGLLEEMAMAAQMKAMVAAGRRLDDEYEAGVKDMHERIGLDDDCGYDLNDPKHPTFRERHAGEADALRKREKEQRADWINPPGRSKNVDVASDFIQRHPRHGI